MLNAISCGTGSVRWIIPPKPPVECDCCLDLLFGTNYRCLLQSSSFQESIAGNPILVTFLPLSKMLIDLSNPSAVGTLVDKVHQERKSNAAKEPRRHPMI
jgi:hypothetical protein